MRVRVWQAGLASLLLAASVAPAAADAPSGEPEPPIPVPNAAAAGSQAPAPATGGAAARVTAVLGSAKSGGDELSQRSEIGEGGAIETGEDGNAAVLLEEDALVELCGGSSLRLARNEAGNRVLQVDAGEARIVVEPRLPGERIEIHTPAAIATILGTIVYVKVDPDTGETTFTADKDVEVKSSDPSVAGSTRIAGGEETRIVPGQAPGAKRRLSRSALANLGGCLGNLHQVSVSLASAAAAARVVEKVAANDLTGDLPGVGADEAAASAAPSGGSELGGESNVIDPFDGVSNEQVEELLEDPIPEPCVGLPGAHCSFP